MAKNKIQKEQEVKDISEALSTMKSGVFIDYQGLSVSQTEELRGKLREVEGRLKMTKRNLLKVVLKDSDLKDVVKVDDMPGSMSLAYGLGDEVAPAKVVAEFQKNNEALGILGGILEGKYLTQEEVITLSKIPSRPELLAQIVGSIAAPLRGLVGVMQGNLRNLVGVLSAIQEKK